MFRDSPLAAHIPCAPHLAAEVQAPPPLMMDCDGLSWRPLSNGNIAPDSPLLLISFCAPRLRMFSNGRAPFLLPPPLPPTLPLSLPAADSNFVSEVEAWRVQSLGFKDYGFGLGSLGLGSTVLGLGRRG